MTVFIWYEIRNCIATNQSKKKFCLVKQVGALNSEKSITLLYKSTIP